MQACKPIRNARKLHLLWQLAGRWAGDVTRETYRKFAPYGLKVPSGSYDFVAFVANPSYTGPSLIFTHLPIRTYYTRYRKTKAPRYGASKIDSMYFVSAALQRLMQSHRTHNLYLPTKQHERRRDWTSSKLEIACITFYASIGSWSFGSII